MLGLACTFSVGCRDGIPVERFPEAIVGKWKLAGSAETHVVFTFWPSGICSFVATHKKSEAPAINSKGKWTITGNSLKMELVDVDFRDEIHRFEWTIKAITADRLTYSSGSKKENTLIRIDGNPDAQDPFDKDRDKADSLSFAGSSKRLLRTVIVPVLSTPLVEGRSAIWCATLPLAWQQMEKEVVKGPADLVGAEEVSRGIRASPTSQLRAEDYYVAAGLVRDGIVERINEELGKHFPGAPQLNRPDNAESIVAYASLEASVPFQFAFRNSTQSLQFKDSKGKSTPVKAFGLQEEDKNWGIESSRSQVRVLFGEGDEFALDPSRHTKPYQLVLARIKRRATLQDTLEELERRTASSERKWVPSFGPEAVLLVPNMNWQMDHSFPELEGKKLRHADSPRAPAELTFAKQFIHFKLDRRGAILRSRSLIGTDWSADDVKLERYVFDRPYLIVLRNRDSQQPFFVMWVDNAELLVKQ